MSEATLHQQDQKAHHDRARSRHASGSRPFLSEPLGNTGHFLSATDRSRLDRRGKIRVVGLRRTGTEETDNRHRRLARYADVIPVDQLLSYFRSLSGH